MSNKLSKNEIFELLDGYNSELENIESENEYENEINQIRTGKL